MALENAVEVHNGKATGAYASQAKNVSYGNGSVEDALDGAVKVYRGNKDTSALAVGTTHTISVDLPPTYNELLAAIPYADNPNDNWNNYLVFSNASVGSNSATVVGRVVGSGSAQVHHVKYIILYR